MEDAKITAILYRAFNKLCLKLRKRTLPLFSELENTQKHNVKLEIMPQ